MRSPSRATPLASPHAVAFGSPSLIALVALVLRHLRLDTTGASTAARTRALLVERPALLVVDVSLRGGLDLVSRAADGKIATIALVDLERGASSFEAFSRGADQVVRIPFTPDELAVRAAALYRRTVGPIAFAHAQPVDGLELSLDEQVHVRSRRVALDPTDNSLLYLFAARLGRPVSFSDVRRFVWGVDADESDARVGGRVAALARTLGPRALVLGPEGDRATLRRSEHE